MNASTPPRSAATKPNVTAWAVARLLQAGLIDADAAQATCNATPEQITRQARRDDAKRAQLATKAKPKPRKIAKRRTLDEQIEARRARRQRKRDRHRARERALHAKVLETLRAAPHKPNAVMCRLIPLHVWERCRAIVADPGGKLARFWLAKIPNRVAAGTILRGAFDDEPNAHWGNRRTRRLIAVGLALLWLSQPTKRKYGFTRLVMGIPREALAALVADPFDPHDRGVCLSTLSGEQRGQVGYLKKLHAAGFMYRQQLTLKHHADKIEPCEVLGPSGHATNRYWVCAADPLLAYGSDEARKAAIDVVTFADDFGAAFWRWLRAIKAKPPD